METKIHIVSVVLTQSHSSGVRFVQRMSHHHDCTEDEARGAAAKESMAANPGYSVALIGITMITVAKEGK